MPPQNTVTVTGSDRTRLLADLTVRLGRVEVVEEQPRSTLSDGSEGWQLTVSHRPFVAPGGARAASRRPSRQARARA